MGLRAREAMTSYRLVTNPTGLLSRHLSTDMTSIGFWMFPSAFSSSLVLGPSARNMQSEAEVG